MGQQSKVVERELSLRAADGVQAPAFVAEPAGASGAPRVVIAPEIFGLTPWIKAVARRLAREGFRAVAPEIFARDPQPLGADRASWMNRMRRLDVGQAVRDLRAGLDHLEPGPSACIGFCLGGALCVLLAAGGNLESAVDCYGRIRWLDGMTAENAIAAAKRIRCPMLAIYGRRDAGIPVADAEALAGLLPPKSELALYEAGHAFLNDTRPDMYVADQADLAWAKIVGFLRRTL
ncbi:MAG TPA: dienelactone hydrolase family protein [Myxococcales bacterium]|nr:dienelactone hydrolase family protein [Myxococcales bacterium]